MTKAKKDNTAQRARTAANKARRIAKRKIGTLNPLTQELICSCGLVVKIRKYKIDRPYVCALCRTSKIHDHTTQTTRT